MPGLVGRVHDIVQVADDVGRDRRQERRRVFLHGVRIEKAAELIADSFGVCHAGALPAGLHVQDARMRRVQMWHESCHIMLHHTSSWGQHKSARLAGADFEEAQTC
jgi:hypothetical protein